MSASTPASTLGALPLLRFCAEYGVGLTKAYEYIKRGELRAIKAGRSTLIRRADAEAWLNSLPQLRTAS